MLSSAMIWKICLIACSLRILLRDPLFLKLRPILGSMERLLILNNLNRISRRELSWFLLNWRSRNSRKFLRNNRDNSKITLCILELENSDLIMMLLMNLLDWKKHLRIWIIREMLRNMKLKLEELMILWLYLIQAIWWSCYFRIERNIAQKSYCMIRTTNWNVDMLMKTEMLQDLILNCWSLMTNRTALTL